jgi:3-oxoacyl-[acyl-carrier protein] reductase
MLVNFIRLRELSHAAIPGMRERGYGRIVNITGSSEPRNLNAANSAKAAVHAWSKGLSREIAQHGITINCIQPGRIISEQILRMHPTEEDRRKFAEENIPARRFGEAEELANLAIFLASPRASYITGTVIPVDGGMSRFAF